MSGGKNSGSFLNSDDYLKEIKRLAGVAEKSFFFYLSFVVFTLVTTFSITDSQLFFRQNNIPLPNFDINISVELFLFLTPLFCIFFYIYFTYYMLLLKNKVVYYRCRFTNNESDLDEFWIIAFDSFKNNENFIEDDKIDFTQSGSLMLSNNECRKRYFWSDKIYLVPKIIKILKNIIFYSIYVWLLPLVLLVIGIKYSRLHELPWEKVLGVLSMTIFILNFIQYIYFQCYYGDNEKVISSINWLKKRYLITAIVLTNLFFALFLSIEYVDFVIKGEEGIKIYFLGSRSLRLANVLELGYVDFTSRSNFYKVDELNELNFRGANLKGAKMSDMTISECDFSRGDLTKANLTGTKFINCIFDEAKINDVNLYFVEFKDCSLIGTEFSDSRFFESHFYNSHLEGADFYNVELLFSSFNEAYLEGSNFNLARIYRTHFIDSYLNYTSFENIKSSAMFVVRGLVNEYKYCYFDDLGVDPKDIEEQYLDFITSPDLIKYMYDRVEKNDIAQLKGESLVVHLESASPEKLNNDDLKNSWFYSRVKELFYMSIDSMSESRVDILFKNGLPEHLTSYLNQKQKNQLKENGIIFDKEENNEK